MGFTEVLDQLGLLEGAQGGRELLGFEGDEALVRRDTQPFGELVLYLCH